MLLFPLPLRLFFFSLLLLNVQIASASPTNLNTNGYRLARGLPPLPPRDFGQRKPGQDPTPVLRARASPSPSSVVRYTGRLQVRSENRSTIGYVQDKSGLPVSTGSDLVVSVTASLTRKEQLNILATPQTTTALPSPFYIGASTQSSSENATIGTGVATTLQLTNVTKTDALSKPVKSDNVDALVESAIWTINSSTKELTAQYVNPDGSLPSTFLVYDNADTQLYLVGDTTSLNATFAPVKLFIVD
ncbi:hypothetical protein EV360DRAFT_77997 [Lentinula raphanica]|nr:hypothetical protein EV360DRAFT_77997 [Lentinula raphanica]